jgi:26S proteasome regulatory subunit N7
MRSWRRRNTLIASATWCAAFAPRVPPSQRSALTYRWLFCAQAKALEFYDDAVGVGKGGTVGQRIDCSLAKIRLAMVFKDRDLSNKSIADCHKLVNEGGDWERRNRLKVYESVHLLSNREFKKAAELLLESLATFTCLELVKYEEYIFYTVVAAAVALDRVTLKKKVLHAPEILSVIDNIPGLKAFVNALYSCDYATFFQNFPTIVDQLFTNRYLVEHVKFFEREMCVVAYTQFLESYRSVTVASMAAAFGVSEPFLDAELSRYIATGRLHAKIDKVGGVVETNRPDAKNTLYQDAIKKGDQLLNRIQKLSRVINV